MYLLDNSILILKCNRFSTSNDDYYNLKKILIYTSFKNFE